MDAHLLLLFLSHVTTVEFYERTSDSEQPTRTAVIRLAAEAVQTAASERKEFLREIEKRRDSASSKYGAATSSYRLTTELLQGERPTTQHWAISQLYSDDDDDDAEFSAERNLLPWVAVATPLSFQTSPSAAYLDAPGGQVFCFLPLPLETESPTGLRVHVHGYFAVDSNRRHLKERTGEQLQEAITDRDDLLWNEHLVARLLPKALVNLVLYLARDVGDLAVRRDAIFTAIPQLDAVHHPWKPLASAFLGELHRLPVFYSPVHGGQFLTAGEVFFDDAEDESPVTKLVRLLLRQVGTNLVSVPGFVLSQLGPTAARVTPPHVCVALRNSDGALSLTDEDRTVLLQYLTDSLEDMSHILGTRLLALADGSWIEFTGLSDDSFIYVDSPDHPRSLLPGLDHLFVRNDVVVICRKIADTGMLLRMLRLLSVPLVA